MIKRSFVFAVLLFVLMSAVGAVSEAVVPLTGERIEGSSRYDTALKVAHHADPHAQVVTVVTGKNFPDAISAAGMKKGLVVFADDKEHAEAIVKTFPRLKEVYILGSYNAVGKGVEDTFKACGKKVVRAHGKDRYETSLNFAKLSEKKAYNHVVLATGENFPDGISAANIVASEGEAYVILTPRHEMKRELVAFLKELAGTSKVKVSILGGEKAISTKVEQEVKTIVRDVSRYSGTNRYNTAQLVARSITDLGNAVVIASGQNFADALASANLAKAFSYPLVFAEKEVLPKESLEYINNHRESTEKVIVLGSTGVISDKVLQEASHQEKKPAHNNAFSSMPNFSLRLAGENFGISNENTQARLDKYLKEFVNWGSNYRATKRVGDGKSLYLTAHVYPYGHLAHKETVLQFKGSDGVVGTYELIKAHGPFPKSPKASPDQIEMIKGERGDTINIQTCLDASGTYKVYEFKLTKRH